MTNNFSQQDEWFMAKAIELAKQGRFTTTPNPNVGCVIVKDGQIVAEGWHQKSGFGHAEVRALSQLSHGQAKGATAYVTLEPCSHTGKTPPCALKLVDEQVARVVIAMKDPNPLVAGKGITMLENAGIEVTVGCLGEEARALNPGFLSRMERQQPFVQLKLATSMDGKIALHNGKSKWITGSEARADVQQYRAQACAIISTSKTVLTDNARLDVRPASLNFHYPLVDDISEVRQPVRVILDRNGDITPDNISKLALLEGPGAIILLQTQPLDFSQPNVLSEALKQDGNGVDLTWLLNWCNGKNWNQIWVEAGSRLASEFIKQNKVDELIYYQAPKWLGKDALDAIQLGPFNDLIDALQAELTTVEKIGSDVKFVMRLTQKRG